MKKIDIWFYLASIVLVIFLYVGSYGQLLHNFLKTPDYFYYFGGDYYALDATGNIAHIRQGYEGEPLVFFNLSTSLENKPTLLKFEYILIGKIARIFSIPPDVAFTLAKVVISLWWMIFLFYIISYLWHETSLRIFAMVAILLGTAFLEGPNAFAYTPIEDLFVFYRLTLAMPHYLLGGLLSLCSLFFFARSLVSKRGMHSIVAIVTGILSGFVYGPNTVMHFATLPFFLGIEGIRCFYTRQSKTSYLKLVIVTISYGLILAIPVVYTRFIVAVVWKDFNLNTHMEKLSSFSRTPLQFFFSMGITYVISLFSLPTILKKKVYFLEILFFWIVMLPIAVFIFSPRLDLNQVRFYLTPYFIVFGLLATAGVQTFSSKRWFVGIMTGVVIVCSLQTLVNSWKRVDICFCYDVFSTFSYPPKDMIRAIQWLDANTTNNEIILSDTYAGAFIPPFSGNKVYTSWWFRLSEVPEFWYTHGQLLTFFKGELLPETAREFLEREHIAYIFYGPQERQYIETTGLSYPGLKEVASFGMYKIYKVL